MELYFTNKLLFWLIFNAVSFVILLKKMYPLRNIASAEFTHADYWSEAEHEVNPSIVCGAGLQECNGTCNKSLTALGLHMRITNPRIVCGAGLQIPYSIGIEGAKVPISYNLLDVVGSTKDILLQNMTNLQYNSKEDLDHIISVDKGTLSTFSFVPSYFSLLSSYKSYQFTLDYFNLKNGNLINNLSISETLKQRINKDITLIQNEK